MTLPFTIEEFLAVFARYNQAIWPVQIVRPTHSDSPRSRWRSGRGHPRGASSAEPWPRSGSSPEPCTI